MTQAILNNISFIISQFFTPLDKSDSKGVIFEELKIILGILNISLLKDKLIYRFEEEEYEAFFPSIPKGKWTIKHQYSTTRTPLLMAPEDMEDIEKVLNDPDYSRYSGYMSKLFEGIGWKLNKTDKYYSLAFVGPKTLEYKINPVWKKRKA